MEENLKKLYFRIRLAGYLGAIPTVAEWQMFQATGGWVYLATAVMTIVFSIIILVKANDEKWQHRDIVKKYIVLAIIFAGLLPAIPLFFALKYTKKDSWE